MEAVAAGGHIITAILSYSRYAGRTHIKDVAQDVHGNPAGALYDLGADEAFRGLRIAVLELWEGYEEGGRPFGEPPAQALRQKGFELVVWRGAAPPVAEFIRVLQEVCQLWVISSHRQKLTAGHLDAIHRFSESDRGLYIWGDNDPYYVDANAVLRRVLPGVVLQGNDYGDRIVGPCAVAGKVGFMKHLIFTGVAQLYEGITIARVVLSRPDVKTLMHSSHGHPVVAALDDGKRRIVIDGGFTRLYEMKWSGAGTARFVKNVSAWLCGIDADWI